MEDLTRKTVAVFSRPFIVPGLGETLQAGEYDIEAALDSPPDHLRPEAWKASVLVKLHPGTSHPGLSRTLTVSLADLDHARARDKLTGRSLFDFFFEEMPADPMVRLVMEPDAVSETQLRHLYSGLMKSQSDMDVLVSSPVRRKAREHSAIEATENEGMPPRPKGAPPARNRLDAGLI